MEIRSAANEYISQIIGSILSVNNSLFPSPYILMKHTFLFIMIACYMLSSCSQKLPEVTNTTPGDTQSQLSGSIAITGDTASMLIKADNESGTGSAGQTTSPETYPQVLNTGRWTTAGYEHEFGTVFMNHEVGANKEKVKITLKGIQKMYIPQLERTCYTDILNSKIIELIRASKDVQVKNIEKGEAEVYIDGQLLTDILRMKGYLVRDDGKAVRELTLVCLPGDGE